MHLLDSDTLTHYFSGNRKVRDGIRAIGNSQVATTIITRVEMLRGRLDYLLKAETGAEVLRAQQLLFQAETDMRRLLIVPFNDAAVVILEQLRATKGLRKIGRADLLIASIALANRAILVTRNLRDFRRIPNLQVVNWVD